MKIDVNQSIFVGQNTRSQRMEEENTATEKKQNGTIFAGDLNCVTDPILQRKQEAREKAMKIVSDTWEGDKKMDMDIVARRERIRKLQDEMGAAQKELNAIACEQETLQKTYGVDKDSEEYKDLELLLKRKRATRSGSKISLTEEERKQLAEIDKKEKTEYQSRVLELEASGDYYHGIIADNKEEILTENAVIRGIRQERLKKAPMVKAQQQAEATLEAASEDILGMLQEESLNHMEEEQEAKEEQATKVEEKQEEQEELIEKRRTEKEEAQERAEELAESMPEVEMLQLEQTKTEVQKEIQNIVDKMKLVAEDVKGAVVDEIL